MDDDRRGTEHGMQAPARPISLDTAQCTITRREQARRATAEELIGLVAHDLRGYLTPLDGYIALLRMSAEREGRVRDAHHARAASTALANLTRLTTRLLTAARPKRRLILVRGSPQSEARRDIRITRTGAVARS